MSIDIKPTPEKERLPPTEAASWFVVVGELPPHEPIFYHLWYL